MIGCTMMGLEQGPSLTCVKWHTGAGSQLQPISKSRLGSHGETPVVASFGRHGGLVRVHLASISMIPDATWLHAEWM
jgi:hypothetical protein